MKTENIIHLPNGNNEISKKTELPRGYGKELEKLGLSDLQVGDVFITNDNDIIRIVEFYKYKAQCRVKFQRATTWEANEWEEDSTELDSFQEYYVDSGHKLSKDKSISEYWQEAKDLIEGRSDISIYEDSATDSVNDDRSVMNLNSKESLIQIQNQLEQKKERAELIKAFVGYEMEKRRQELEAVREKLKGVLSVFKRKIEKIMRVITTIELYLGIDEELFQIQSGEPAPDDTPISFRQQVLYMDEEIGRWQDGGADYSDITEFDEWLLKPAKFRAGVLNHEVFLPEKKGMVVFRPRRDSKHYSDDWMENAMRNKENYRTYLFIKNGENIYRVYTEKIVIEPRLFPQRTELMDILKEAEEYGSYSEEKAKEKIDDMMYHYRKRAVLMQGLIDRSEVFLPLKNNINIFKLDETPKSVNFIYDDEATLPSGRKSFKEWWMDINSKISEGSRILITGEYDYRTYSGRKDFAERFYLASNSYDGLKNVPDLPLQGVYEVEEFTSTSTVKLRKSEYDKRIKELSTSNKEKFKAKGMIPGRSYVHPDKNGDRSVWAIKYFGTTELTIMYMPTSKASSGWNSWKDHDRKNKTRFKIYRNDEFVMNYDQISLDDVIFYLTSRVDRYQYLSMMPVLEKIYEHRVEEMKHEADFSRLVLDRNVQLFDHDESKAKDAINKCIEWWKLKNKWKRPVAKDDVLALRMIEKKLKDFK